MSKFNLTEGLGYKDLAGMMKSTMYIDDFSSKMGDDDEIVVASFYVRDRQAAIDIVNWFEKGYDFDVPLLEDRMYPLNNIICFSSTIPSSATIVV